MNKSIYSNEYISFTANSDEVYIETFKNGFTFEQLNHILSSHPEIEITSFSILKSAINSAPKAPDKVGRLKERICIELVDNDLKAMVVFNLSKEELDSDHRQKLILETSSKLKEKGIVHGIKTQLFTDELVSGKHYMLAEGTPPVNGTDSILNLYQLQDPKPDIHEDEKVNYYEIRLINRVKAGEWLGERLDATKGTNGVSVKGVPIKAIDGKTLMLQYDRNTVSEIPENGKTTLLSRINGAVCFIDGKISVSNHLEIDGSVDFKTGNINFDGYVTIKGTVSDGFMVMATKDIEINSELGLGHVKGIISTNGSIFIKGGIASKNNVEIKAAKNIYTKFVDNASLICGESAHIGFYSINSTICAKEVIIDSSNGHIIGGNITAGIRVFSPTIGSEIEKRTIIEVTGFDRARIKEELEELAKKADELKNEQQKVKAELSNFDTRKELDPYQRKMYNDILEKLFLMKDQIKEIEQKRKLLSEYLKTRGEGEITISKKIYPNCQIIIKKHILEIYSPHQAVIYYVIDNELKEE